LLWQLCWIRKNKNKILTKIIYVMKKNNLKIVPSKKRVISLSFFVVALIFCMLTSCNDKSKTDAGGKKKYVIGVSYESLQSEFTINLQKALQAKAKELGVEIIEVDGMGSGEKQVGQVENFITQGVDAIILQPIEKDATVPAVEMANNAKIPIVVVNAMTANIQKANAYVGSEDVVAGRLEMEEMAKRMGGKGNIVIIHGPWGNSAEQQRTQGIKEVLKKYPDIKIVFEQTGNWDRAQGLSVMENVLSSGKVVNALISQNDEMAIGAYKAIEAAGKQKEILVSGIDAIADALTFVKEGKLACTVFQDAKGQGALSVKIAADLAAGKKYPHDNFIPFELVTKENLAEFLKKHP
jgi:inositol transport system substrate-binding protein